MAAPKKTQALDPVPRPPSIQDQPAINSASLAYPPPCANLAHCGKKILLALRQFVRSCHCATCSRTSPLRTNAMQRLSRHLFHSVLLTTVLISQAALAADTSSNL